jgi:hypothetical protein
MGHSRPRGLDINATEVWENYLSIDVCGSHDIFSAKFGMFHLLNMQAYQVLFEFQAFA